MTDIVDLLTRTLPIMLGGGVVQIVILLVKRRADIRSADVTAQKTEAETDAVVVASAERSVILSDQMRDRAVKRTEQLVADLTAAESQIAAHYAESRELRLELAALRREVEMLRALVATKEQ